MNIAVGCDHRGLAIKELVFKLLTETGHSFRDFGCDATAPVDYPDIAWQVGKSIIKGESDFGILICGTGIGMCIAANKIKGIRAAQCYNALPPCVRAAIIMPRFVVWPPKKEKPGCRLFSRLFSPRNSRETGISPG